MLPAGLRTAFTLLTRLPASFGPPGDLARSVWAFPVVGLAVGGLGALVYGLMHKAGIPALIAAGWTLAATMAVTGGFHEDGLADTADGFGGGATPARKLDIMRDSRIGSYGALALVLSVLTRTAAIASLDSPTPVMAAMIVAGMLGRSGILAVLLVLRPVRPDGMGAAMGKPHIASTAIGIGIAVAAALLLLPLRTGLAAAVLGLGSSLAVAGLAHRQIGGHTGDVLGAAEVLTECVVLSVAATSPGV